MNILRATSEAIYLYKTRPEQTLPVIARYMRVPKDDPALIQSQETFATTFEFNADAVFLRVSSLFSTTSPNSAPRSRGKNPADFIERKFLRKLEEEGFFKQFAAK